MVHIGSDIFETKSGYIRDTNDEARACKKFMLFLVRASDVSCGSGYSRQPKNFSLLPRKDRRQHFT